MYKAMNIIEECLFALAGIVMSIGLLIVIACVAVAFDGLNRFFAIVLSFIMMGFMVFIVINAIKEIKKIVSELD